MLSFLAALVGYLLFVLALTIGAMAGGRALRGSCGGDCLCDPGNARTCPRRPAAKKETTREGRAA